MPQLNLLDMIVKHHPELKELYESEQYQLADRVLELQMGMRLGQDGMATKLGLPLEDYLAYENGTLKYSVEDYQNIISKMELIQQELNQG